MAADALRRKLTAIVYADVTGYLRLTGEDKEGTHRRVMAMLDYVSGAISESGGKVLRYAEARILELLPGHTATQSAQQMPFACNEKLRHY